MSDPGTSHDASDGDLPATMRAVRVEALGGPEVLRPAERPLPEIGPGDVLIRAAYAGVNFADVKARRGGHHISRPVPYLPGLDVSGTVVAVGEGVEGLRVGQRVAAATDGGAYAEYVKARAVLTYALPDPDVDLREVAGIVAMMTAYNVLMNKAVLQAGETVLVHAAAGGVGTLLLQLARHAGAGRVLAVVGSDAK
ncbi:MAG: alcohol dehydrogenase catalytic domain-containing protein, partial [Thioalkalivibrio sp.]|nr:alcohol dehydrogenase catalytic domain-containing protein [Thioalkalivibrio sp.]